MSLVLPCPLFAIFLYIGLQDDSMKLPSQANEHLIHLLDLTSSMTIATLLPLTANPLLGSVIYRGALL
jgi:hypothetical protein